MEEQNINVIEGQDDKILAKAILDSNSILPVGTRLETDQRVIARVTDGIYRQPASALRELISNAYDADATKVIVKTDAPRFSRISIEDDGHGMSPQTLAYMLKHIGGSAKRNDLGKELGVTSANSLKSPNGRKLIGKIGIGIFSVAQLTHTFQIITKTRNDPFRTVATINLRQYTDEAIEETGEEPKVYESGLVTIWREEAIDLDTHGTTIVLTNIRPQARDTLQSKEIWSAIEHSQTNIENPELVLHPPKYHIGKTIGVAKADFEENLSAERNVPWESEDNSEVAFSKFVDSVWNEAELGNQNPRLEKLFDYYLQMVWNLSLATPIPYVQNNIFDLNLAGWSHPYLIANEAKGIAKRIPETDNSVRVDLDLTEGLSNDKFEIFFDNLKLSRPIKFQGLPTGGHRLRQPVILVGKCTQDFTNIPKALSGGRLKFEAYLYWNPIIAPAEHRGVLIRINGASGTLFDQTFMRYQVSEQTRLRQITCEIFIQDGFDSALNIDRESFNFAHPHAVYLTRWLHNALRQLATAQKRHAAEVRYDAREELKNQYSNEIQKIALDVWHRESRDEFSFPPIVEVRTLKESNKPINGDIILHRLNDSIESKRTESINTQITTEKIKAITQILASFGLLEKLSDQEQQRLLNAIYEVLATAE